MYSAIILSVYGVTSKLSSCSTLFIVLFSDWREAHTLNLLEHLIDSFLFSLRNIEVQGFDVIELVEPFENFI